jgi:hypothetical protein
MCEEATERQLTSRTTRGDREFQLGVLLVHGIGTPRSGDTLVRWGDVLLKTIERATRKGVVATVQRAGPGDGPANGGFQAAVLFRADDRTERWLLSECWWADAFPAPSYRELVSWSVRALPWSIATHIAERYWQRPGMVAGARAYGQLAVALALSPILVALLGLALLLGLLPIPQIRTAILAVQSTLTATVGDSFAFVESPVRAALVRTRILDGLERLNQCCKHTMIVAHSQGAAAAVDALGGMILEPHDEREGEAASRVVPDALVTFGAGTKKLNSQKVLSAGLPKTFTRDPVLGAMNPVLGAVLGLLLALGLSLWLYLSVLIQQTTLKDVLWAFLLLLLASVVIGLILSLILSLLRRWHTHKRARAIVAGTLGAFLGVGPLLLIRYLEMPIFESQMLVYALLLIVGSMPVILSAKMKKIVTQSVRKPPGLVRWVDLYASHDPVPNGATVGSGHESIKIWNLGSVVADHTAYWDNRDGFVLRVATVCAETAQSPWSGALPRAPRFVDDRAAWRVYFLRMARLSTGVTWLVLGVILWSRYQAYIPVFDVPGWVPAAPARFALLVTFVASAMWATSSVLRWLWNFWVRAEQEAVLAHDRPGGESHADFRRPALLTSLWYSIVDADFRHPALLTSLWYPLVVSYIMGMVVWMLIIATTYILMNPGSWTELGHDAPVALLVFANFFAAISAFVVLGLSTRRVQLPSDRGSANVH